MNFHDSGEFYSVPAPETSPLAPCGDQRCQNVSCTSARVLADAKCGVCLRPIGFGVGMVFSPVLLRPEGADEPRAEVMSALFVAHAACLIAALAGSTPARPRTHT